MTPPIDVLAVGCPYCGNPPGVRCGSASGWSGRPHKARERAAYVLAAQSDPALDAHFPMRNPCGLCGSGLPQRHRMVEAVASALENGEDKETVTADLGLEQGAVRAVRKWMRRWPGAWR